MKRYETYKDSGIQWWEEIPTHWDLKKAKHIFSLVTENVSDSSLPKIALENIESWTGKYIETDSDFMGEGVEFKKDDILFGKLRPYLAKVYKAEFAGQAVGDIYVFRGNEEQNPEYLKYLLLSYPFISVVDGSTYGAKMPRANWDFISHLVLPCPPKTEQVTIAAFLDRKVSQIDATIAEKEQMLEDLKAYRSAIISEAVTKGLDKNVEMKDSGIEWMGRVPKHWKISKLKYTGAFDNGLTYSPEDVVEKGILVLRSSNIQNGHLSFDDCVYVKNAPSDLMVEDGDIIICSRNGSANLVGKCAFVDHIENSSFGAFMMRFRPCIHKKFAFYAFQASTSSYKGLYSTSTINQITKAVIDQMFMVVPPIEEQERIADYIDKKITNIDSSLTEVDSQIADLKSYKSVLITEAVTGKIDLREWKPQKENV